MIRLISILILIPFPSLVNKIFDPSQVKNT